MDVTDSQYQLSLKSINSFQFMIFSWWEKNRRDLPWRRTHDPYKILVSELMLQQTQVSRVLTKYEEFLIAFPTLYILAEASTAEVLRTWKGMGYNRRALYLKQLAEIVVKEYGGKFPQDEKRLQKLPGLGEYTARALLVFAFKKDVAAVDTNIRQIITHYFFNDIPKKESLIEQTAIELIPRGKSWEWHQALMDYGALALPSVIPDLIRNPRHDHKGAAVRETPQSKLPFRQTNRFFRGRIIDALREGDRKKEELVQEMEKKYDKSASFLVKIIDGLERDGLLERAKNGIISLPK